MKWINCGQAPDKIALLTIGVFIHFFDLAGPQGYPQQQKL
jgi:hypothetical protein